MYFDNASTTYVDPQAIDIIYNSLQHDYHNPSAIYYEGRKHFEEICEAKQDICKCINAINTKQIYFTSGGSEGNNWAIRGLIDYLLHIKKITYKPHIITSHIEHHSVLNVCKLLQTLNLADITYLSPMLNGKILLEDIKQAITDNTVLVSIMTVNNVLGSINPIQEIGTLCHEHNVFFHTDAVQAIGKINIDVQRDNIDILTCSGHKIHAPKGIGFIYIKNPNQIQPLIYGGLQENGLRAGTENLAYIKALQYCINKYTNPNIITLKQKHNQQITDYFIKQLSRGFSDKIIFVGDIGTINIAFKNIQSDILVWELGQQKAYVSVGSACDNGLFEDNYVLQSINYHSDYIKGNLRITFDENNTLEECEKFIDILQATILRLRGYL